MIIKKSEHKIKKLDVLYHYVHHRQPDKEKAKKMYYAIKDEMAGWRWDVAQEFIISEKVPQPDSLAWSRLKEARDYFINNIIKKKGADPSRTKVFVWRHCEDTADGQKNIHYHVLLLMRNERNQCMLAGKKEVMSCMYRTFLKYDPERAKKLEKYVTPIVSKNAGPGRGSAPVWQAQLAKQEIKTRLDKLEVSPEWKNLLARVMTVATYNKKPYQRKYFIPGVPLHLQRVADRVIGWFKDLELVKRREQAKREEQKRLLKGAFKKALSRAKAVKQEIDYHRKRGPGFSR